jgi:hypothetical protein
MFRASLLICGVVAVCTPQAVVRWTHNFVTHVLGLGRTLSTGGYAELPCEDVLGPDWSGNLLLACSDDDILGIKSTDCAFNEDADLWVRCALEGEFCYCSGEVRFGYAAADPRRSVWGPPVSVGNAHLCSATAGDPAPGKPKVCECKGFAFLPCATEGRTCECVGAVRYGVGTQLTPPLIARGALFCSGASFGISQHFDNICVCNGDWQKAPAPVMWRPCARPGADCHCDGRVRYTVPGANGAAPETETLFA